MGKGAPAILVYPNPVTDGSIHLQMNNMPKGTYGIQLINNLGQIVFSKVEEHPGGSGTETINPGKNLPKGSYHLEVTSPDKSKLTYPFIY
jgi:hypothetical protein